MKAYIKAVDYYLPDRILTNEEIARLFPQWSAEKVASKAKEVAEDAKEAVEGAIKGVKNILHKDDN